MSYYVTTKKDVLTTKERMQFNRIKRIVDEHDGLISDIWSNLGHGVTDTLECGIEMSNFEDDLVNFIFRWVMGEKMNDIEARIKDMQES